MHGSDLWPNWVGGVVAVMALPVDASMGHLLQRGFLTAAIVLGAVWLPAAVLVLARIAPGAWRRTPRLFAGIAVAHPVTEALGFAPSQTNLFVSAAVLAFSFVILVVPMDRCLAHLDARRSS